MKKKSKLNIKIDLKQVLTSMDIDEGIEITFFDYGKKILVNRNYLNQFVLKIYNFKNEYIKYINSIHDVSKFIHNEGSIKKICYY